MSELPRSDVVILGGLQTPGRAVVKGFGSPRMWDKRKGYGTSGATLVYTGDDLSKGSIVVTIWTGDQYEAWLSFAGQVLVKPPKGARPKALPIEYPTINAPPISITAVVVEDVTPFEQDEQGEWTCEIKLEQYRAPMPALGKPNGAIPPAKKTTPTAQDAADVEIQKLMKQFGDELAK